MAHVHYIREALPGSRTISGLPYARSWCGNAASLTSRNWPWFTENTRDVTCGTCKRTKAWQTAHHAARRLHILEDLAALGDPTAQVALDCCRAGWGMEDWQPAKPSDPDQLQMVGGER